MLLDMNFCQMLVHCECLLPVHGFTSLPLIEFRFFPSSFIEV